MKSQAWPNFVLQGTLRSAGERSARTFSYFIQCVRASRVKGMRGAPEHGR